MQCCTSCAAYCTIWQVMRFVFYANRKFYSILFSNSTNSKVVCCYSEYSLSTVFVHFKKTAQNSTKMRCFYITLTGTPLNLFCDIKHVIVNAIHSYNVLNERLSAGLKLSCRRWFIRSVMSYRSVYCVQWCVQKESSFPQDRENTVLNALAVIISLARFNAVKYSRPALCSPHSHPSKNNITSPEPPGAKPYTV